MKRLGPGSVTVPRLEGFTRAETIELFERADAFIDLHMVGPERANYEAALFDSIPIVYDEFNGMDRRDFPGVPRLSGRDIFDSTAMAAAVSGLLSSCPAPGNFDELKAPGDRAAGGVREHCPRGVQQPRAKNRN